MPRHLSLSARSSSSRELDSIRSACWAVSSSERRDVSWDWRVSRFLRRDTISGSDSEVGFECRDWAPVLMVGEGMLVEVDTLVALFV